MEMASGTESFSGAVGLWPPTRNLSSFSHLQLSVAFPAKFNASRALKLNRNVGFMRRLEQRRLAICCEVSNRRLTQQEFTEMAWQAIVSSPDVAKENKQQVIETQHLMQALLEQKNGLARRIFSKVGVDNTKLLEATEKFIQHQQKVYDEAVGSTLGHDLEALLQRAREYKDYGDSVVSVEHLVIYKFSF